ncbi:MAG TPA: hypothetical protein VGI45_02330 [Terracidiphilus sp.]
MANSGIFGLFGEAMEKFHRDDEEFTLFFNAVGLWLNREIDEVNSGWAEQSIEGVRRSALKGKTGVRKLLTEPTFELTANDGCTGFVRLSLLTSAIEVEIEDASSTQADGDRRSNFRLKNTQKGAKAFCLEKKNENPIEAELQPEEVAKIVVAAVVRGYFI